MLSDHSIRIISTQKLDKTQKSSLMDLWNDVYPTQLGYENLDAFERYLEGLSDLSHVLVLNRNTEIIGWYFDFIRDDEKWFAILLTEQHQGQGVGTQLLNKAKAAEHELNGWVIDHSNDKLRNAMAYASPLEFYVKNSFEVLPDIRLELEKISAVKIRWRK